VIKLAEIEVQKEKKRGSWLKRFSTESRYARQKSQLEKKLEKERKKTERYTKLKGESEELKRLKEEINGLKAKRGKGRKRHVKIGGYDFAI
jgi:hypothetical protein